MYLTSLCPGRFSILGYTHTSSLQNCAAQNGPEQQHRSCLEMQGLRSGDTEPAASHHPPCDSQTQEFEEHYL